MESDDVMSDDGFELDDTDAIGIETNEPDTAERAGGSIPVWRLIEMSRENRSLQQELADFDDYTSEAR